MTNFPFGIHATLTVFDSNNISQEFQHEMSADFKVYSY